MPCRHRSAPLAALAVAALGVLLAGCPDNAKPDSNTPSSTASAPADKAATPAVSATASAAATGNGW